MRLLQTMALAGAALVMSVSAFAQEATPSGVPRNETLIVENPEGTIKNPGWFNIWAVNAGGRSTGLHQLTMDTFSAASELSHTPSRPWSGSMYHTPSTRT